MRVRMLVVLALGALALVAAGCGGDESSDAVAETTAVEETMTEETMTEEMTTDDGATSTGEIDLGNLSEDCLSLAAVGAKFAAAFEATSGSPAGLDDSVKYFEELVDAAPDEIKDDLDLLAGAIVEIAKALEGVDLSGASAPSPEVLAKLQEVGKTFEDPALKEASANIEAWTSENCGANG